MPESEIASTNYKIQKLASNLSKRVSFISGIGQKGRIGIWTSHRVKTEIARALNIRVSNGLVYFHKDLVSVSNHKQTPDAQKKELMRQLGCYERRIVMDANGELKDEYFDGKRTPPDDLAIALQIVNLYSRVYMESPKDFSTSTL